MLGTPFPLRGAEPPRPVARIVPAIAGLAAAGFVAAVLCQLPRSHIMLPGLLFASAIGWVLAAVLASALTIVAACALFPNYSASVRLHLVLDVSSSAAWLVPLALLLRLQSAWVLVAAGMLAASIVPVFRRYGSLETVSASPQDVEPLNNPRQIFDLLPAPKFRDLVPALAVTLCAEAAAVGILTNHMVLAVLLSAVCSAILAWAVISGAPQTRGATAKLYRVRDISLPFFATLLALASLLPRWGNSFWGEMSTPHSEHGSRFVSETSRQRREPNEAFDALAGDSYSGIILLAQSPTKRFPRYSQAAGQPPIRVRPPLDHRQHSFRRSVLVLQTAGLASPKPLPRSPWQPGGVQYPLGRPASAANGSPPEPWRAH